MRGGRARTLASRSVNGHAYTGLPARTPVPSARAAFIRRWTTPSSSSMRWPRRSPPFAMPGRCHPISRLIRPPRGRRRMRTGRGSDAPPDRHRTCSRQPDGEVSSRKPAMVRQARPWRLQCYLQSPVRELSRPELRRRDRTSERGGLRRSWIFGPWLGRGRRKCRTGNGPSNKLTSTIQSLLARM